MTLVALLKTLPSQAGVFGFELLPLREEFAAEHERQAMSSRSHLQRGSFLVSCGRVGTLNRFSVYEPV